MIEDGSAFSSDSGNCPEQTGGDRRAKYLIKSIRRWASGLEYGEGWPLTESQNTSASESILGILIEVELDKLRKDLAYNRPLKLDTSIFFPKSVHRSTTFAIRCAAGNRTRCRDSKTAFRSCLVRTPDEPNEVIRPTIRPFLA